MSESQRNGQVGSGEPSARAEHSAEHALIEARRAKAARVRERGENPFANDVRARAPGAITAEVRDLRAKVAAARDDKGRYAEDAVKEAAGGAVFHVRGRVMALRSTGGLTFLKVRDRSGEIQLLASQAEMGAEYTRIDDLDLGDIVEAEGALTASKRGELSIAPSRLRLVTKAIRPLPEKWHGLQDVETRYRQRYVDLVANPHVADVFRARSHIVRATRAILDGRGFLEVETPTLTTLIGGALAKPFTTHHNALDLDLFLRIAPELFLKRLLVGGLERVYEIGRCYRNEGISTRHNPEFTMVEFYWAYATHETLMDFTEELLRGVDRELASAMPEAHAAWEAARPFTLATFARVPMHAAVVSAARKAEIPAWNEALGDTPGAPDAPGAPGASDASGAQDRERARAAAGRLLALLREDFGASIKEWAKSSPRAKGLDWSNFRKGMSKCENDGERLFALYEYLAEPHLVDDYRTPDGARSLPVFVTDHPFETSPLARRNDAHPELVDRFELFIHGRELCNAFSELNDPDDQAARFREQVAKKARGAEEAMDYDEDYVRALEHGMPPAAGFGMGIDRLVMMLTNAPSIRDVILFPLLRPVASGASGASGA